MIIVLSKNANIFGFVKHYAENVMDNALMFPKKFFLTVEHWRLLWFNLLKFSKLV